MITIEGIVLKERSAGEQDKFIDILTKESGVIEISVKGAKKINGKTGSSTQLFAYSRFCIQKRKENFFLNSAEPIHIFYDLRRSLTKLTLASYFADILRFCCVEEKSYYCDIMRLFLNTLYYLENNHRDEKLLKSIFELRLMSEIGFMPNVLGCNICGNYEPTEAFFCIEDGCLSCSECITDENSSHKNIFKIELPFLKTIRHIVLMDYDNLFNFRISEKIQQLLSVVTETYLLVHMERSFNSLEFYKSIDSKM